jgi:hypothetical protein
MMLQYIIFNWRFVVCKLGSQTILIGFKFIDVLSGVGFPMQIF